MEDKETQTSEGQPHVKEDWRIYETAIESRATIDIHNKLGTGPTYSTNFFNTKNPSEHVDLFTKKYVNEAIDKTLIKSLTIYVVRNKMTKKLMARSLEIEMRGEMIEGSKSEGYMDILKVNGGKPIFDMASKDKMCQHLGIFNMMFKFSDKMQNDIVEFLAPDKNDADNLAKLKQELFGRTWDRISGLSLEADKSVSNSPTNQHF